MPLVTVLIPTHDHADTIRYSIASVRAQTIQDFEILVVGDGAPPRTDEIMDELCADEPRLRYLPNPKGAGHGEAHRHAALATARGKLVCYLGDDDLWLSDHLETMATLLASADFAHTTHVDVQNDGSVMVLAGDLNATAPRRRMLRMNWGFFGPTSAGHTLEAYRRLPSGWRARPDGVFSDLHMWRQWLDQSWCKFHSEPAVTTLHFPSDHRKGRATAERVAELEDWWRRVQQPGFREWLERERLCDWQRRLEPFGVCHGLGVKLLRHGELEAAELQFRQAIDGNPRVAGYHRMLAEALARQDSLEEATAAARTAVELEPTDARLQAYLGHLLTRAGQWKEAAAVLSAAIDAGTSNARVHHQASLCLAQLGRCDQALQCATRAVELDPHTPEFRQNLARLGCSAVEHVSGD